MKAPILLTPLLLTALLAAAPDARAEETELPSPVAGKPGSERIRKTRVREDLLLIYFPVDDRIYAFFFLGPRSSRCAQSRLATSHGLNLVFKV